MELISTAKIVIAARYDIIDKKVYGNVYCRETEEKIGTVKEVKRGIVELQVLPGFEDKEHIKVDFEKLKPELVDFANFWHAR